MPGKLAIAGQSSAEPGLSGFSWPVRNATALARSRWVTGIPAYAAAATPAVTPGRPRTGCRGASSSASSPPRPNTNGSRPSAHDLLPGDAVSRSAARSPPATSRAAALLAGVDQLGRRAGAVQRGFGISRSWTITSAAAISSSARAVSSPGSPGPAPDEVDGHQPSATAPLFFFFFPPFFFFFFFFFFSAPRRRASDRATCSPTFVQRAHEAIGQPRRAVRAARPSRSAPGRPSAVNRRVRADRRCCTRCVERPRERALGSPRTRSLRPLLNGSARGGDRSRPARRLERQRALAGRGHELRRATPLASSRTVQADQARRMRGRGRRPPAQRACAVACRHCPGSRTISTSGRRAPGLCAPAKAARSPRAPHGFSATRDGDAADRVARVFALRDRDQSQPSASSAGTSLAECTATSIRPSSSACSSSETQRDLSPTAAPRSPVVGSGISTSSPSPPRSAPRPTAPA